MYIQSHLILWIRIDMFSENDVAKRYHLGFN